MLWLIGTRYGSLLLIGAALVASFNIYLSNRDRKTVARVSAQIEKKVEAHAQKADEVRKSIADVPASGLRDKWTRD